MLFHSYSFLFVFLPVTWLVFMWLKRRRRGRLAFAWLTVCSFAFYAWWNPPFLLLILVSISANFSIGSWLSRAPPSQRLSVVWLGVLFNIGLIGYFKYAGFLAGIYSDISGAPRITLDIVLPLAISFYTFQQIAYLVDIYRGGQAESRFLDYVLFVVFFPQLIAGPIIHPGELLPQLKRVINKPVRRAMVMVGLSMLVIGMFKKVVIADNIGQFFATAYPEIAAGALLSVAEAWAVMTASALQIYFDYSGYADMAAGLGLLFGVRLPLNFFSPYKATSPIDFWRRWNITLMRFLRDYVYIPLGGSRYGETRKYAANLTTMLVCGLWHGAGWNFLAWGAAVGAIIVVNGLWNSRSGNPQRQLPAGVRIIAGRALTFVCYLLPLGFFMFPSLDDGLRVVASMLGHQTTVLPTTGRFVAGIDILPLAAWLTGGLLILYGLPNCQQIFAPYRPTLPVLPAKVLASERSRIRWRPNLRWATCLAAMAWLSLGQMHQLREFFYFQF